MVTDEVLLPNDAVISDVCPGPPLFPGTQSHQCESRCSHPV